jgi:ABC-2 type transport system permease protein
VISPLLSAWRAKILAARNGVMRAASRSILRVLGMVAMAAGTATLSFVIFLKIFRYLTGLEVVGPVMLVRLLSLFFFVLFVMLVMSNVLVSFQTLFRSREADWWAAAPVDPATLHHARSLEIALMSSWAFIFLGVPLLLAYGLGTGASWAFHAALPAVLVLFAACAHYLGLACTVILVRMFPGLDMKRLVALLVVILVPVGMLLVRAFRVDELGPQDDASELLVRILEGLGRTQYPLLPGYWAAETLRGAALGDLKVAGFFLWTLLITAAFLGLVARETSVRWLMPAYQLLRGVGLAKPVGRRTRRRHRAPSAGPLRALASKDVTVFLRDPAQWAQVLLVGVLAFAYVANLRNLPDLSRIEPWGNVASYLNLGVVLLLTSTLMTRFAFPLVSLEGRRAWIVMLAPLRRRGIVRQKMLLALILAMAFALAASAFSTSVLGVAAHVRVVTIGASLLGAFALSGLAVGLGALIPSLKDDNPATIVSGFGGTLDLLLGFAYVLVATALVSAPSVLEAAGRFDAERRAVVEIWTFSAVALVSVVVALVPLWLGERHLERLEL